MFVSGGEICPTCGLRKDTIDLDGKRILYGQGVGHLIVTEEGRKFIVEKMLEEWINDILITCAWIVGQEHLNADDRVYMSARRLLGACVDDIPDKLR